MDLHVSNDKLFWLHDTLHVEINVAWLFLALLGMRPAGEDG